MMEIYIYVYKINLIFPISRAALEDMFTHFTKTGELIQSILNDYLGLPENFLKEQNQDRSWDWMNIKHYFPAKEAGSIGISSHKDGNAITFVLQDEVGGLEFFRDGHWIPIPPSPGSLVVNVGDVIQATTLFSLFFFTHDITYFHIFN